MQDHTQAGPGLKLPWNWPQDALPTPPHPPHPAVSRLLSTSASRSTKSQTARKPMLRKP